jgi:phospholipid transport system substrate-binding protein
MAKQIAAWRVERQERVPSLKRLFSMNWILRGALAALLMLAAPVATLTPAQAQAGDPAVATVQTFYDGLTASMKAGGSTKARAEKLKPEIEQTFDLAGMTALSVGPKWASTAPADQKALIDAFSRYTFANYARNFDSYGGEKFIVDPAVNQRGTDKYLKSTMKPTSGDTVAFNYRLHEVDGKWKIIDVYLAGNISTLAQKRADFGATLDSGGASALVKKLNALTDQMLG